LIIFMKTIIHAMHCGKEESRITKQSRNSAFPRIPYPDVKSKIIISREDTMYTRKLAKLFLMFIMLTAVVFTTHMLFAEDDDHFIQPDDYFISNDDFKSQAWIRVTLAKMKTPPSAATKNEAEFMQVLDGKDIWTKYYWSTRIAGSEELKIGAVVIMLDQSGDEGVYRAPENKDEARQVSWFMAKITDMSDLYKGYVTVSGGYKVDPKAIRVIVKK